ncbi:MAG: M1 family aminopeptidase [Planctomycetota bacterium]|nr:M1 family aminopeptidase [Planctomycetota bacterium]
MSEARLEGFGCGRRTIGFGLGAREPFAFPGTTARYAPDRSVDIQHTALDIRLDPAVTHIEGTVSHTVKALDDDTREVRLHADELTIEGVEAADGTPLPFRHVGEDLHVSLERPLEAGEETTVRVRYHGTPRRGIYFIRPDEAYPDKPVQAWTQGQDEDSKYWFPCFDHPSEKMSTEVRARVPESYTAVSNGALVGRDSHDDGTVTWHWKQAHPHSAYLVTLAVGAFEEIVLREGKVPLTAYVPAGTRDLAERAFERTAEMVDVFEERFGVEFPYEKYAQVVVEDFIFGGMENTTATTLIDLVLFDDRAALDFDMDPLVAHELAHQWWGDLLTCREWAHAWLNEGFATWSEVVWEEHRRGPAEAAYYRYGNAQAYRAEDGGEYRRAIVDKRYDEPIDLFDRHLYDKGGLVLHMLRKELGEGPFWRAIRTYANENRGRTVVTEDLRRSIESATGRDMDWFLDQWVFGAGHPELKVAWKHDADTGMLAITVKQTQKGEDLTPAAHRFKATVEIKGSSGARTEVLSVTRREHTFHLPCAMAPELVLFDPEGDLLADIEHEHPVASDRAVLAGDAPVIAKIRAAQRLGKDPSAENLSALTAALSDSFWGVVVEVAKALGSTRHPAARDALIAALDATEHPKARRGIAAALGSFRGDGKAGDALKGILENGDPSLFVETSAAAALGQTRVNGAQDVLEKALREKDSWAESIRLGCIRGLAALGTEAVLPTLLERAKYGQHPRIRQTAAEALATVGRRLTIREPVLDALADMLAEGEFRMVMAAIRSLRALGDPKGIAILGRAPGAHPDGRVRRAARVAASRLRKGSERTTEVAKLSDELETMRAANAKLLARVEQLEQRLQDG